MSPSIEGQLNRIAPTTRLAGADRYAASVSVNAAVFPHSDTVYLATGDNFPDALTGAAWAARGPAPLLVVPSTCVPTATLAEIRALGATKVTLLGGPKSLTEAVRGLTPCG
ncbi:hypothetical protein GCM10025881_10550 [Pseudolysinimonas kribbensis]|uniref:Cell wall-binding repeat-containing protein n=1 Tax=Pseudolysinimonas kribbensis TaxID=433641 RepID=A0ABQ6K3C1_9MICO|nr:cell wall-binding repeat-containing protein [Pseudolysinimonas kribbensis]GMA94231.1 hypothetical protein GCM10025881_10550 [Pseudolysinimonas kribbensis]